MFRMSITAPLPGDDPIHFYMDYASRGMAERARTLWLRRYPNDTVYITKI